MSTTLPTAATASTAVPSTPIRVPGFKVRALKVARKLHLYLGVFSAPALLFFALSGALQTFSLHQAKKGSDYRPPNWIAVLGELHKNQMARLPVKKVQPDGASTAPAASGADAHEQHSKPASSLPASPSINMEKPAHHPLPLKIFFLIVSLSLSLSVLTGIYMAYQYNRNQAMVTVVLLAGLLIPALLTLV